jgi:serine/threonine-protein kinase
MSGRLAALPSLVGRYRISSHLSGDLIDDVYTGFDPLIERPVAVRVFHDPRARPEIDERVKRVFYEEMQRAGALTHHGITTLFDAGELPGQLFMATEFAEATRLATLLHDGLTWTIPARMAVLSQIVDALEYARELGMPHLRLRPTNVLVGADQSIKISGFGAARVRFAIAGAAGSPLAEATRYAAPEHGRGQPGDHRSDVFSLARLAFDLLADNRTGQKETTGDGDRALPPHLAEVGVSPDRWLAVFDRALSADPADRFDAAAELEVELLLMLGVAAAEDHPARLVSPPMTPIPVRPAHGKPGAWRAPEPDPTRRARTPFVADSRRGSGETTVASRREANASETGNEATLSDRDRLTREG